MDHDLDVRSERPTTHVGWKAGLVVLAVAVAAFGMVGDLLGWPNGAGQ